MKFLSRREQYNRFLEHASRVNRNQVIEALEKMRIADRPHFQADDVFEFCPFNDLEDQIFRTFDSIKRKRPPESIALAIEAISEFLHLCSDFQPPCCYDGRTFYGLDENEEIILECNRCLSTYHLDGKISVNKSKGKMTKNFFIDKVGIKEQYKWPYHSHVRNTLTSP